MSRTKGNRKRNPRVVYKRMIIYTMKKSYC
jgi:hypothetical protein